MMKPPQKSERRHWFSSHAVHVATNQWRWFNPATEQWQLVDYDDVPTEIWSQSYRRDGWRFYTDRTRECDEHGFPLPRASARAEPAEGDAAERKQKILSDLGEQPDPQLAALAESVATTFAELGIEGITFK